MNTTKLSIFLTAAFFLLCPGAPVQAEIKYFTHIQADVPAGWSTSEHDESVVIAADDKSAVITITVQSAQGDDAEKIAGIISKSVNGTMPVEDVDNNGYFFNFTAKQVRIRKFESAVNYGASQHQLINLRCVKLME